MRNLSLLSLPVALVAATTLSTAGCAAHDDSSDPSQVQSDLAQTNGGFNTNDEQPMFGEEAAFDDLDLEADAQVTDAMASDPTVASVTASPTLDAHRVMIVWGKLPRDPDATDSRDWSGQIAVNTGALLVGRTVGFEPATDRLLPRTDIKVVPFDSVTKPYIDGLVLRVLEPQPATTAAVTLTYTSAASATAAPITYSFDLAALQAGPVKVDAGNGYVMVAVELTEHACNHGFMRGRWQALTPNLGVYRGIVTDEVGLPVGHVKGIYGVDATAAGSGTAPTNLLFGKFIDHEGKFIGLIRGTYGDGDLGATWVDRQGDHGIIHGKYFDSTALTGGAFFARYAESTCAEDSSAGSSNASKP